MKEGWEYKKLGDICEFISGFTPSKEELNPREGIPYFKVSDMNRANNDLFLSETELYVAQPKKVIPAESIVFPKNGGAIFTGKKRILAQDSIVDLNTEAIKIRQNVVLLTYLYRYLLSVDFGQFDNGGGLPSINIKKMKDLEIPVPPLSEQQRIVSLLDAQFERIDMLKRNAEHQLKAAKDLFQSALKEMLTPKEGWEEKELKSIGKTQTGCTPSMSHKEYYNEDYIPFIKPSEINYDGIGGINYDTQKLSKLGAENGRVFDAGSIYMVCIGTIGKLGYSERVASCNQQINVLTPNDEYHSKFMYYALLNPAFQNKVDIIARSAQATLPIISKGKWEKLTVFIPSLPEQERIAARLDAISEKVKALQANYEQTITLCNDLKQSLLKSIFE